MQATETGLPAVTEALEKQKYVIDPCKHLRHLRLPHLADVFIQSVLQLRQDATE